MISIQFFARYRETLGSDGERIQWDESFGSVDDVRQYLLARGGVWEVLGEQNLMCARNQELCASMSRWPTATKWHSSPP